MTLEEELRAIRMAVAALYEQLSDSQRGDARQSVLSSGAPENEAMNALGVLRGWDTK